MRINKRKLKGWVTLVTVMLVCVLLVSVIGKLSGGSFDFGNVKNWDKVSSLWTKTVNPANLLKKDSYTIKTQRTANGISVEVLDDGGIKVTGTATADFNLEIATVTGLFTTTKYVATGCPNGSVGTYYIDVYTVDGATTAHSFYGDFGDSQGTYARQTTLRVYLAFAKDAKVNTTIYPVLVEAGESTDFYV